MLTILRKLVFYIGKSEELSDMGMSSWHRTKGSPVLHAVHPNLRMYAHSLFYSDALGR